MNATNRQQKQYRPYLTADEIIHVIQHLSAIDTPQCKSVVSKLRLLSMKIEAGVTRECYVTNPKPTMLEKLGGTSPEESRYLNGEMSPEEEEQYLSKLMNPTI